MKQTTRKITRPCLSSGAVVALLLLTGGCAALPRPAATPVAATWHRLSEAAPAQSTLLVLLPGRQERPGDFERQKFFADLRPDDRLDVVSVDLHLGYYRERSLDRRLREDVLEPARRMGYRRIEMLGISLGGLGALIYDERFPGEVDRIVLLSPYTGGDAIIEEIQAAGGLRRWAPETSKADERDVEIWTGWKSRAPGTASGVPIELGVGKRDRFRAANAYFAGEFLGGKLDVVEGGHDWPTWTNLFRRFYGLEAGGPSRTTQPGATP